MLAIFSFSPHLSLKDISDIQDHISLFLVPYHVCLHYCMIYFMRSNLGEEDVCSNPQFISQHHAEVILAYEDEF